MSRLFLQTGKVRKYSLSDDYEIIFIIKGKRSFRSFEREESSFREGDIFCSFLFETPLEFRIAHPEIPRENLVFVSRKDELEEDLSDLSSLKKDDYDFFSGEKVKSKDEDVRNIIQKYMRELKSLTHVFIDAGYYPPHSSDDRQGKIDDWMVTFEDPLQKLFVNYAKPETRIPYPDTTVEEEFLINPNFRSGITEYFMKVLANFMISNKVTSIEEIGSLGKGWEDVEVWNELKEIEIEL